MEACRRGAGGDGLCHHARLSRGDGRAGLQGDRPAAAFQSRPDGRCRSRQAAHGLGVDGHHARDRGRAIGRAWWAAFRRTRQGAGAAARDAEGSRRSQGAVHLGHPDRHRRDARRADRVAAGAARPARSARPSAGSHHPELPGQARHTHGERPGAVVRRVAVDRRGRAADLRRHALGAGAAQPAGAGLWPADRRRHRRLGRRLAGHARSRQSRAAVAAARRARRRKRALRQGADRAACRLSALRRGQGVDRSGPAPARTGDELRERPAPRQRLAAGPRHAAAAGRPRHAGGAGGAAARRAARISAKATSSVCSRRAGRTSPR
jgi:hypothetical protein